jgi:hypothetical protein
MKISSLFTRDRKSEFLLVSTLYVAISVFFLFSLIFNSGDVAQNDWAIPLTASAAINDFSSRLFVHSLNGFGEAGIGGFGFPFFQVINAVFAPIGFVGGAEIKILAVFLVSLGGITAYLLARSFRLSRFSSFLSGLFFMTTPVVFNWLMFGWIYYILAYDLFPLMILTTKKFMETGQIRYTLINGLILVAAVSQPAFILVYPAVWLLFVLFECKGFLNALRKGLMLTVISLSVWFLTALTFFTSFSNAVTLSFYNGDFFGVIQEQFRNFAHIINPIRLWGSSYNFQFETYFFPWLIVLTFVPAILAALLLILRPRDKRVLFFFLSYLFAVLAFFIYNNLQFFVFQLPFGGIFEAPSVFLVPASLGLAFLMGYFNQIISSSIKLKNILRVHSLKYISFFLLLLLIISVGNPWWTGQASGNPLLGPTTKLNLYSIPSGFTDWSKTVPDGNQYFVLYLPLSAILQIPNSTYFSQIYDGVNGVIFTEVNNLPYISISNSSLFLSQLMDGDSGLAERWGSFSIRYIVVYTNVESNYDISNILNRLSNQSGIVEVDSLPSVVVFEDQFAKPLVYSDQAGVTLNILHIDPALFKLKANSNGSFVLILNQIYNSGWKAWVNNSVLPDSTHFKDANGFNGWRIASTGDMTIDLYYEPQTTYIISMAISAATIIAILFYLVFTVVRKNRRNDSVNNSNKGPQFS